MPSPSTSSGQRPPAVALWDVGARRYPDAPPYHPSEPYPEYPFPRVAPGPENPVYRAVREMLHGLGMDANAFGTAGWNPLGGLVQPGNTVILKPNFVVSEHPLGRAGIEAAVVHASVLRPLADYALIALQGRGRIIVADSPIKEVDFQRILEQSGISAVKAFYDQHAPLPLEALDFRDAYVERDEAGFMAELQALPGDPQGYTLVDLEQRSMFQDVAPHWRRLRSTAVYYENVMEAFHDDQHNVYSIPNTLLRADAVISVAKLKTHRKGGVTLSLKNAVGITNEKRGLPHHRVGAPREGGDAVANDARLDARLEDSFRDFMLSRPAGRMGLRVLGAPLRTAAARLVKPLFRRLAPEQPVFLEGDWYGNDTVWRMALDLNHLLLYADQAGQLQESPQRRYLSVVDGVIAGEGEGPLFPTPKGCGILLVGQHPVAVDLVAARLMGYDWRKIPMLREAISRPWPLRMEGEPGAIPVHTNRAEWRAPFQSSDRFFSIRPSAGWRGHIELSF
ncbi:MAG: DUF362 domain-containing protein [Chloroflexi bacterium]|nr:DUF362 domain-containing protein [Chloroflexota bacterium]